MKRLVLDLRSNPGGQLDQAIRIVNLFVQARLDDRLHARPRRRTPIRITAPPRTATISTIPMIVLVNRNSASASEIVSGALQDHDRALVVGETTFGKALVQSVYRVSQGAGLALTTARYFTPSGRMIQRPWDGTFDEYLTYTLKDQAERPHTPEQLKYTTGGRKVYSGGGIEPDRRFDGPVEGFNPTRVRPLALSRVSCSPATPSSSPPKATRAPARRARIASVVRKDFVVDDAMVQDFKQFVDRPQGARSTKPRGPRTRSSSAR